MIVRLIKDKYIPWINQTYKAGLLIDVSESIATVLIADGEVRAITDDELKAAGLTYVDWSKAYDETLDTGAHLD